MTLAPGTDYLESERLVLRRITEADLEFFNKLHADPEVARYIGPGRPRSAEESRGWFESVMWTYENLNLGQLAVRCKSDGRLIGRCGLSDLAVEAEPSAGTPPRVWYQRDQIPQGTELVFECELGYTFDPASWGKGYATEAARCVFEYACSVLRLSRVISIINPSNTRSLRVASRFDLQLTDSVELLGKRLNRYVWRMPGRQTSL
jgi:[ribosomal protein S5]-alanine N-acetyltransferase